MSIFFSEAIDICRKLFYNIFIMALAEGGIKLFGGVSGNADVAVEALIEGGLDNNPDVRCNHHDREHGSKGHTCESHGCGK